MLKSRDITMLTKICIVKAVAFLIVMYYCEGWITKKVEHQITYFFLNYGKVKTFESPLDYKEIIPASPKGNPP